MSLRILIVDDSRTFAQFFGETLKDRFGFDVSLAPDGFSALKKILVSPANFDAVFLDLHMPGLDGLELLQMLGKFRYRGGVVLVSQLNERIIDMAAQLALDMRLHVLTTLSKPFSDSDLDRVYDKLGHPLPSSQNASAMSDSELQRALDSDDILPYFQAQIDIQSRKIIGFEALARIKVPGRTKAVTPVDFMEAAKSAQLLKTIDMMIFKKAAQGFVKLAAYFPKNYPLQLSVNLLPEYLEDPRLPNQLVRCFSEEGISPSQVCLEVTERSAMQSSEQLKTLNRLRISGFMLAIDDFGTGYTNIKQLRSYPFTEMKIDRSLVCQIDTDPLAQTIVKALVRIARAAELKVVAEGVERPEEMEFLSELPGVSLQGYLVSRPQGVQEQKRWASSWMKTVL